MVVTAIIQARMGSTRLNGKTMANIAGRPFIWHVIDRLRHAKKIDEIILATTINKDDDVLEEKAKKWGIKCFRGSSDNVLERFYNAAKKFKCETIIRITADDPFKEPPLIDNMIDYYIKHKNEIEFMSNDIEPTFPDGFIVEIFPFKTLELAYKNAKTKEEKEHLDEYMLKSRQLRKYNFKKKGKNLSKLRLTLDTEKDLIFTRKVYEKLYNPRRIFILKDIINLLKKEPQLLKINQKIIDLSEA